VQDLKLKVLFVSLLILFLLLGVLLGVAIRNQTVEKDTIHNISIIRGNPDPTLIIINSGPNAYEIRVYRDGRVESCVWKSLESPLCK